MKIVIFIELLEKFWNLHRRPGSSPRNPHTSTPLIGPPLVDLDSPSKGSCGPYSYIEYFQILQIFKGISGAERRKLLKY